MYLVGKLAGEYPTPTQICLILARLCIFDDGATNTERFFVFYRK